MIQNKSQKDRQYEISSLIIKNKSYVEHTAMNEYRFFFDGGGNYKKKKIKNYYYKSKHSKWIGKFILLFNF